MEQNKEIKHKFVETYAEDMAKVLEDDKSGVIKKIIHGEEEHEKEKMNLSPESKKNQFYMLMGAILIILGAGTLFYFLTNRQVPTVPVEKQFTPLIFTDKSSFLEIKGLKKDEISQTLLNAVNATQVKSGGVEAFYVTSDKKITGLRDFFTLLNSSLVVGGVDFVSDNFLMGVANGTTKDFFILIKVRSISDIFDDLRAWEGKIFFDLHGFFGVPISADTKYLLSKNFEDRIVQNKNARVLYDNNSNIVMMYIFADDNSVIITNTESAAREIMLRLASSKVQK